MAATVGSIAIDLVTNATTFADGMRRSAVTVQAQSRVMGKSFGSVDRAAALARRSIASLGATLLAGVSVNAVSRYADQWTKAGNAIRSAAEISGRHVRSLEDLNDIAQKTRTGFSETTDLYARLTRATKDLRVSEVDVASATEIVNKAFKAGGAAASEQASGILQLGQALQSGFLQGDELRSIRENAPLLAQAIAEYFNTTIGGLKALGEQGLLTSEKVFKAVLAYQKQIDAAFNATVPTIEDGKTAISNAFGELVNSIDKGTGASAAIAGTLIDVSKAIDTLAEKARSSDFFELLQRLNDILTVLGGWRKAFVDIEGAMRGIGLIADGVGNVVDAMSGIGNLSDDFRMLKSDIEQAETALADMMETGAQDSGTVEQIQRIQSEIEILKVKFDQLAARAINAAAKMSFAAQQAADAFEAARGIDLTNLAREEAKLPGVNAIPGVEGVTVTDGGTTPSDTGSSKTQSNYLGVPGLVNPDPGIPKFAAGGVVTGPTVAQIGEAGPEAVVPLAGGNIPVSLGGSRLSGIEINTAKSVDRLDEAIGYLQLIESGVAMLEQSGRVSYASSYGGSSSGASSDSDQWFRGVRYVTGNYGVPVAKEFLYQAPKAFAGFATGGVIDGDSQAVQFLKGPQEKVVVARPDQFEDLRGQRSGGGGSITLGDFNFSVAGTMDQRAAQELREDMRRTILDLLSGLN